MIKEQFNILNQQKKVLVAPLNWGLGHATRCVPLIRELQRQGCEVLIAAGTAGRALLQKEFPDNTFIETGDYGIKYGKNKFWFPVKILLQIPKIAFEICKEHRWLKKIITQYGIDAVISDNRFGLFQRNIPSVYITHQLTIKTGNAFTESIARKIHYWFIKKYDQCWVPDFSGDANMAGELSHPSAKPSNVVYLGGLSRLDKESITENKYDLLIIISGPEPLRTIFENKLFKQLENSLEKVLFIRGLPGNESVPTLLNKNIEVVNHLSSKELAIAIRQSALVISRSGYTTVMDLVKLQKQAILVPTPGQTEQEYLAKYLAQQKIFYCADQNNFVLEEAIHTCKELSFSIPAFDMEQYKKVVEEFVRII